MKELDALIETKKLSVDQLIDLGLHFEGYNNHDKKEMWIKISQQIDWDSLSKDELLRIGNIQRKSVSILWKVIFRTKKLTIKEMEDIAFKNTSSALLECLIETGMMSIDQMLELAKKTSNNDNFEGFSLWSKVTSQINSEDYQK